MRFLFLAASLFRLLIRFCNLGLEGCHHVLNGTVHPLPMATLAKVDIEISGSYLARHIVEITRVFAQLRHGSPHDVDTCPGTYRDGNKNEDDTERAGG